MSQALDAYQKDIIKKILVSNQFGITEVVELESIVSRFFDNAEYKIISQLIENNNIPALKQLPTTQENGFDFLEIMLFKNQQMDTFIITIYDSLELWQDPEIIQIYPITQKEL